MADRRRAAAAALEGDGSADPEASRRVDAAPPPFKPPPPPPFVDSEGQHVLVFEIHTGRGVEFPPGDPLKNLPDLHFVDDERTQLGTPARPVAPPPPPLPAPEARGLMVRKPLECAFVDGMPAREVDARPPLLGQIQQKASAAESRKPSEHAPRTPAAARAWAAAHGERKEPSPTNRVLVDDPVVELPPLDEALQSAIARLKMKNENPTLAAAKVTAAEAEAWAALGRAAAASHSEGVDKALLPDGLADLAAGVPASFELTEARMNVNEATLRAFLDEVAPRRMNPATLRPASFRVCAHTGRHCGCRCGPINCYGTRGCDPCREGTEGVSEFAAYGPGLTLYFKWVKLVAWLLLFQALLLAPVAWVYTQCQGLPAQLSLPTAQLDPGPLCLGVRCNFVGPTAAGGFPTLSVGEAPFAGATALGLAQVSLGALGAPGNWSLKRSNFTNHFPVAPGSPLRAWDDSLFLAILVLCNLASSAIFCCVHCTLLQNEEEEIDHINTSYITPDMYTIELNDLPPAASAPEVKEFMDTQILKPGEEVRQVTLALDYAPFLRVAGAAQAGLRELEALECRIGAAHRAAGTALEADKATRRSSTLSPAAAKLAALQKAKEVAHASWFSAKNEMRGLERSGCDVELLTFSKSRLAAAVAELGEARAAVRDAHEALAEERAQLAAAEASVNADAPLALSGRAGFLRVWRGDVEKLPPGQRRAAARWWDRRAVLLNHVKSLLAASKELLRAQRTVKAWVMFNSQSLAVEVWKRLRLTWTDFFTCRRTVPHFRRYRGVYALRVIMAPKPGSIRWQSLGSSFVKWAATICLSSTITLACLAFCGLLVFSARLLVQLAAPLGLEPIASGALPFFAVVAQEAITLLTVWMADNIECHDTRDERDLALFSRLVLCYVANFGGLLVALNFDFLYFGWWGFGFKATGGAAAGTPVAVVDDAIRFTLRDIVSNSVDTPTAAGAFAMGNFLFPSPDWYVRVGSPLVLLQTMHFIAPHLGVLWQSCLRSCRLRCARQGAGCCAFASQRQLNLSLRGSVFLTAPRFAHLFACLCVCSTFSLGLPLLLPICALAFFVSYWADLWALSRLSTKPPVLSAALPRRVAALMPVPLLLNAAGAAWFLIGPAFPPGLAAGDAYLYMTAGFQSSWVQALGTRASNVGVALLALAALAFLMRHALGRAVAFALCSRNGRVCAPFRKAAVNVVDTEKLKKKAVNVWEVQEAMALDDIKDNFRDALRSGFLTDVQTYDIRDNPDYFYAFGESHPARTYKDWFPPDPGPPERVLDPKSLPPNEPNTETLVMELAHTNSSFAAFNARVPTEAVRNSHYGYGLKDDEAVILKPKKFPQLGEGRLSMLWKPASRVVAPDFSAPPHVGANKDPPPPHRTKADTGARAVTSETDGGLVVSRTGKRASGVLKARLEKTLNLKDMAASASAAAGGGGGGTTAHRGKDDSTAGAGGGKAATGASTTKGKKNATVDFTEPERTTTNT
jgi:hypothetical protein